MTDLLDTGLNDAWALQVARDSGKLRPKDDVIAQSLLSQFLAPAKGGSWEEIMGTPLTPKQRVLARTLVERGEVWTKAALAQGVCMQTLLDFAKGTATDEQKLKVAGVIDKQPVTVTGIKLGGGLLTLFKQVAGKLKYPKIVLQTESGYAVELTKAKDTSANPGHLYVKCGYDTPSIYVGKISPGGSFYPVSPANKTAHDWLAKAGEELTDLLTQMGEDPATTASHLGKLTGKCCFCLKKLETEDSLTVGYGPTCAQAYGLPWGAKITAAVLEGKAAQEPKLLYKQEADYITGEEIAKAAEGFKKVGASTPIPVGKIVHQAGNKLGKTALQQKFVDNWNAQVEAHAAKAAADPDGLVALTIHADGTKTEKVYGNPQWGQPIVPEGAKAMEMTLPDGTKVIKYRVETIGPDGKPKVSWVNEKTYGQIKEAKAKTVALQAGCSPEQVGQMFSSGQLTVDEFPEDYTSKGLKEKLVGKYKNLIPKYEFTVQGKPVIKAHTDEQGRIVFTVLAKDAPKLGQVILAGEEIVGKAIGSVELCVLSVFEQGDGTCEVKCVAKPNWWPEKKG